jgi:hypothetical protein
MTDDILKIPVQLTKISSKKAADLETTWVIQLEAPHEFVEQVQNLAPNLNGFFVMVLVKINSREEIEDKLTDEINMEGLECELPEPKKENKPKSKKSPKRNSKRKPSKRVP